MGCSPQGSSVHRISQARLLEWVAISFSSGSSWPGNQACVSCIGRQILYRWATREVPNTSFLLLPIFFFNKLSVYVYMWYIIHNIKFAIFGYTVQWHLSTLTLLCTHYHHPFPELFSSCKTETLSSWNNSLLLQPLAATFCLYEFGDSRSLMLAASCTILCVGVIGLFCLACCPSFHPWCSILKISLF